MLSIKRCLLANTDWRYAVGENGSCHQAILRYTDPIDDYTGFLPTTVRERERKMLIQPPANTEYNPYYHEYIRRVPPGDVLVLLETQIQSTLALLRTVSDEQASVRPAPEEWNIKEIIGHICDSERIFAYRALRFARGDETELPGFYQNPYVENGHFEERTLADLLDEFATIRKANLYLFRHLTAADSERSGIASGNPMSLRALVYAIAGHEHHHMESIRTVYLGMAA